MIRHMQTGEKHGICIEQLPAIKLDLSTYMLVCMHVDKQSGPNNPTAAGGCQASLRPRLLHLSFSISPPDLC